MLFLLLFFLLVIRIRDVKGSNNSTSYWSIIDTAQIKEKDLWAISRNYNGFIREGRALSQKQIEKDMEPDTITNVSWQTSERKRYSMQKKA